MLSPDTLRAIELLASELKDRFEPPEYIPGCEVKDVDDKDQYAENNGWIEAVVSKHNRQRCRWKGQFANIETGCFVDVLFYPSYRVYTVSGQSGSGNLSVPASASGTRYDNTSSSLSASTVQQAIDLLATEVAFEAKYNTKGDLIVASADNNASPLGVGSDGYILTADSACTLGVAWKVNAGASGFNFEEKYNAKGDLLIGAADNSASRLPVGASGYVLMANSACDLGVNWGITGIEYTAPPSTGWTWLNQGSSTISSSYGREYLEAASATGTHVRGRYRAAPATPWTVTAAVKGTILTTNSIWGVFVYDSGASKLVTHGVTSLTSNTVLYRVHTKWNSASSVNSSYYVSAFAAAHLDPLWLRITDNGSTIKLYNGTDPYNFIEVDSRNRTDFLTTPDNIGFFIYTENSTIKNAITLLSWQVT